MQTSAINISMIWDPNVQTSWTLDWQLQWLQFEHWFQQLLPTELVHVQISVAFLLNKIGKIKHRKMQTNLPITFLSHPNISMVPYKVLWICTSKDQFPTNWSVGTQQKLTLINFIQEENKIIQLSIYIADVSFKF